MTNIVTYNLARRAYLRGIPVLPRVLARITRILYACEIPYTADIHETVVFAHRGLGVVISHDAKIGAGSKILHHVTIGGRGGVRASPDIGERVLIGAGACVLGRLQVGDGSVIAAQSVVLSDVPAGYLASGVPATVTRLKQSGGSSRDSKSP